MSRHNALGKKGEAIAADYLGKHGYRVRDINWRYGHLEIDIVAERDNELIIVEVKTRSGNTLIAPEEAVNRTKTLRLLKAAEEYVASHDLDMEVRFDIIALTADRDTFTIKHIENYFIPGTL